MQNINYDFTHGFFSALLPPNAAFNVPKTEEFLKMGINKIFFKNKRFSV